jgi:hypothetical protein
MSKLLTYCKPGSFATTAQTFFDLGLPVLGGAQHVQVLSTKALQGHIA